MGPKKKEPAYAASPFINNYKPWYIATLAYCQLLKPLTWEPPRLYVTMRNVISLLVQLRTLLFLFIYQLLMLQALVSLSLDPWSL